MALRFPLLDSLRAAAIMLVLCHHFRHLPGAPEWFKWVFLRGYIGVDIFFVLSGYLIGSQLFRELRNSGSIALKRFWIRRWYRTLPTYYAVLILLIASGIILPNRTFGMILFLQNYISPADWLVSWSICIEEHFYLGLPLFVLLIARYADATKRFALWLGLGVISLSPILRQLYFHRIAQNSYDWYIGSFYVLTHLRLDGLAIGVALSALQTWNTNQWQWLSEHAKELALLGVLIVLLSGWGPGLGSDSGSELSRMYWFSAVLQPLTVAVGVGLLIVFCVQPATKGSFLSIPFSRITAELAYTLYLTHFTILQILLSLPFLQKLNFAFSFPLAIGLSFAVALLFHHGVERPGLRLRDRILNRNLPS